MSKKLADSEKGHNEDTFVFGAIAGFSAIAILQMLSLANLDRPLVVALYSFSISLPTSILVVLNIISESGKKYTAEVPLDTLILVLSVLGVFSGISAILWHFSRILCSVFIVCGVGAFIIHLNFDERLKKANEPDEQE